MNENELPGAWAALEPTSTQQRRMEARVRGWLEAGEVSLAEEWLGLLRIRPFAAVSLAALAASMVLIATPLSWVAFAVL